MNTSEHIDIIIEKFISGQASEVEQQELLSWIEADTSNKRYYTEQKKIILSARSHSNTRDVNKAFDSVLSKIDTKSNKGRIIPLYYKIATIAAVFALMFGVWSLYTTTKQTSQIASIQYQSIDSISEYILADSSQVTLNENSQLTITEFSETSRNVALKGNAYFDIARDESKPFRIDVGFITVEVLGTAFDIKEDTTNNTIQVSVTRGKVRVTHKLNNSTVILTANESTLAVRNSNLSERKLDNDNFLAWKTRRLEFRNTALKDALPQINKIFNKELQIVSPDLAEIPLTARITDSSYNDLLTLFDLAFNIEVIETDSTVFLRQRGD